MREPFNQLLREKKWQALHRQFPLLSPSEAVDQLAEIQEYIAQNHAELDRHFPDVEVAPKDRVLAGVWLKALERLSRADLDYADKESALKALQVAHHVAVKRGECIQDLLPTLLQKIYESPAFRKNRKEIAPRLLQVAQKVVDHPTAVEETKAQALRLKRQIQADLRG